MWRVYAHVCCALYASFGLAEADHALVCRALVCYGESCRRLDMAGTAATVSVLGLIVFGTLASLLGKIGE